MKIGIKQSIDVTKIDKSRLIHGKKGIYLDITTFVDLDQKDQYDNNGFISQSQTKEEREAKAPHTPILGNSKVFYNSEQQPQQQQPQQGIVPPQAPDLDDDIPF